MTSYRLSHTLTVLFTIVILHLMSPPSILADIPQMINYQGKVTDTSGTPVPDGTYAMRFSIYDVPSGGTSIWYSGAVSVQITGGIFNVLLGESPQPSITLSFDEDYWLSVWIDGDTQTPRQRLGSVGYSYMASGVVPGTTISGSVTSGALAALKCTNTSASGSTYGLHGQSFSTEGAGVRGDAFATTGPAYGVRGACQSTAGAGVYGSATATTGTTYGIYGWSTSPSGRGVYGAASATTGTNYGVYGTATSPSGYAGYFAGKARVTGNMTVDGIIVGGSVITAVSAGNGLSGGGSAGDVTLAVAVPLSLTGSVTNQPYATIKATNTATTNDVVGLYGESACPNGGGVFGHGLATTGETYGVFGMSASTAGRGVYGLASTTSGTNYGVYGTSASTFGRGVYGGTTAVSGGTYGGYFESASPNGRGVFSKATASTGPNAGVKAESSSTEGYGVWGIAAATTGYTYGGYFESYSPSGYGVYGLAAVTTGTNYGVYGANWNLSSGYAVYSMGNFAVSGSKSCVVKTSQGPTLLYCQESPENWFEDFGEGQLENGRAHIELDPLFLETVTISTAHPMHVFVQLHDPACEGVAVDRARTGFDVIELKNGVSDVSFSYRIVAKRKGFELKRLDYCAAAENDSYLYPELREQERARMEEDRARLYR